MSTFRKNAEVTVALNGEVANATLKALAERAKAVGDQILEIAKKGNQATEQERKQLKKLEQEQKSLEAAQKNLTKATFDYSQVLNNLNGSTLRELEKAKKALRAQLQHLVPETKKYIDATKDLRQVDERIRKLNAGMREQQSLWQRISSVAAKFLPVMAGVGAVVTAVKKIGAAFVDTFKSLQSTGDAWNAMVAGMENAYKTFMRAIITADWSNFFSNMREAYNVGKEVALMLDELFERTNSFKITDAKVKNEIEALYEIQKDITKPIEERKAAGDKIIELTRNQAKVQQDIITQEVSAYKKVVDQITKMSDAEKEFFIENYNQNIEQIRQAEKLLAAEKLLDQERQRGRYAEAQGLAAQNKGLQTAIKNVDELRLNFSEYEFAYRSLKKYNTGSDDIIKPYVDTLEKLINITNESERSLRRVKAQNATFDKQMREEAWQAEINEAENHFRHLKYIESKKYEKVLTDPNASGEQQEQAQKAFNQISIQLEERLAITKLAINRKYEKDTAAIEDAMLDRAIKRAEQLAKLSKDEKEKQFDRDFKALENFYRQEKRKEADDYKMGRISREQYNDAIAALDLLLLQEKIQLNTLYEKDTMALEDQLLNLQIDCYEKEKEALAKSIAEKEKAQQEAFDKTRQQQLEHEQKLLADAEAIKQEIRNQNILLTMKMEIDALEEIYRANLITTEEYEAKKLDIRLQAASQYAEKATLINQSITDARAALQDAELAHSDANKEKELTALLQQKERGLLTEEQYEQQKKAIDDNAARERIDIQAKYADANFALQASQAVITGIVAALEAYKALAGIPIVGPALGAAAAAVVGVTVAAEIAKLNAEREKAKSISYDGGGGASAAATAQRVVLPGREEGGYTDVERAQDGRLFRARRRRQRGYIDTPTVLTGEAGTEFVANAGAVANPAIRPVLDLIDIAQRNGTIRSIDFPKIANALYRVPGFAAGGYTAAPGPTLERPATGRPPAGGENLAPLLADIRALLTDLKNNGVKAPIVLSELQKKQTLHDRSQSLGSRRS